MLNLPLLLERSFPAQFILAILLPIAFGLLTGWVLGQDETGYLVLSLLGVLGGIGAGYDHDGADQGLVRGIMGGLLFGSRSCSPTRSSTRSATAKLPDPHGVLSASPRSSARCSARSAGAAPAPHPARGRQERHRGGLS